MSEQTNTTQANARVEAWDETKRDAQRETLTRFYQDHPEKAEEQRTTLKAFYATPKGQLTKLELRVKGLTRYGKDVPLDLLEQIEALQHELAVAQDAEGDNEMIDAPEADEQVAAAADEDEPVKVAEKKWSFGGQIFRSRKAALESK